jgi:hypothetical protein
VLKLTGGEFSVPCEVLKTLASKFSDNKIGSNSL